MSACVHISHNNWLPVTQLLKPTCPWGCILTTCPFQCVGPWFGHGSRVRVWGERGLVEPGGAGARDGDGGDPLEAHQHLHPLRHDHRPGLHMGLPTPVRLYINTLYYTGTQHKHPVLLRPLDHSGQGPRNININIKIG